MTFTSFFITLVLVLKRFIPLIGFALILHFKINAQSIEGTYRSTLQTFVEFEFKKTTQEQTYTFTSYTSGEKNYHGYAYYSKAKDSMLIICKSLKDSDNISYAHCVFNKTEFTVSTYNPDGTKRWESKFRKLPKRK